MASNTTTQQKPTNGFEKDDTGQFRIVPWNHSGTQVHNGQQSTGKRKCIVRKFIPIEPLRQLNIEDSPRNSTKKSKSEKYVRKELFKSPLTKPSPKNRPSFCSIQSKIGSGVKVGKRPRDSRYSYNSSKNLGNGKKTVSKKQVQPFNKASPLLDIDEAEELLQRHTIMKKIELPKATFSNQLRKTPKKTISVNIVETPCSNESLKSEVEFLKIEEAFNKLSDISEKPKATIMTEIKTLIKQGRDLIKQHSEIYDKIEQHLNALEYHENKENQIGGTNKIASGIPVAAKKGQFLIPPTLSKDADLRKSVLKNSLNVHYDIQSPRTKKAVDMYNNFRNEHTVLCTPKLDKTIIDQPEASVTRSLSRRIQQQCLLLQDTPQPHRRQDEF